MTDQPNPTPTPGASPEAPTVAWTPPTYESPAAPAVPEPVQTAAVPGRRATRCAGRPRSRS